MEVVALVIKIPANTVRKKPTDYLNVDIDYSYRGPAQRIIFTAVVTQETWWSEFDEIGSTRKSVYADVPSSDTLSNYRTRVPNLPLSGVDPKATPYGVKTKAEGTFGTIEAGNKACLYVEVAPPAEYTLTVSVAAPAVGYVTKSPDKPKYTAGETVTLTAYLDSWAMGNYVFDHWTVNGVTRTGNPISIIMDRDRSVVAYFKEVAPPAEYTINVTCEPDVGYVEQWVYEAGWVQRYPAIYADGERIMLIAVSPFPEYYRFSYWSGDLSGTNASKEFYIHKNMNVVAHFVAV